MDFPTQEIKVVGPADPWSTPPGKPNKRKGPIIAISAAAAALVVGGVTTAVLLSGDDEPQAAPPVTVSKSSEPPPVTTSSVPSRPSSEPPPTSSATSAKASSARTTTTSSQRTDDEVTLLNKVADQFTAAVMSANKPVLMTVVCDPGRIREPRKPPPGESVKRSGNAKVNGTTGTVMLTVTADGRTATEAFNARKQNGKWCMTMR